MADLDKVIATVEKLLRLAAPTSGAPEPERASAALEAARLMTENELEVCAPNPSARRRRAVVDDEDEVRVRPSAWVLSVSLDYANCDHCNQRICPSDVIWLRVLPGVRIERRHNYGGCAIKT